MKAIDVLGKQLHIDVVDSLTDEQGDKLHGLYDPDLGLIKIRREDDRNFQVIIHEVLHATFHRLGLRHTLDEQLEEVLCDTIATVIDENFKLERRRE